MVGHVLKSIVLAVMAIFLLAACGGGDSPAPQPEPNPNPNPNPNPGPMWPPAIPLLPTWMTPPECPEIIGPSVATLSLDSGATVLPNDEALQDGPEAMTHSVVAVPAYGRRVLAARGTGIYLSNNGGCSWQHVFDAPEPLRLAVPMYPWYAYGIGERGDTLFRFAYPPFGFTEGVHAFDLPFHAIDATPMYAPTLNVLTSDGRIMRLRFSVSDIEWQEVGMVPTDGLARFIAVNYRSSPHGSNHIVLTMETGPPRVTFDSGETWIESQGILQGAVTVTTGRAYFSTQFHTQLFEDIEIWIAVKRERADSVTGIVTEERAIALSTDRGLSFTDMVVHDGVTVVIDDELFEHMPLVTQRNTSGEVYFASSGCPDGEPRIYHYRAADDSLTVVNPGGGALAGIGSIFFQFTMLSDSPDTLYIGHRSVDTCS